MMPNEQLAHSSDTVIGNEDDIIKSFENDTFLKKYKKANNQNLAINLQIDNLLLWLNSEFVPNFLTELPNFTSNEVKDYLNKTKKIKRVFSTLSKSMERQSSKNGFMQVYTCSKCNTTIKRSANHSVSVALQQHEHIEEALANPNSIADNAATVQPVMLNYCGNCLVQLNLPTNFKFSFNISYHPDVERFLYMHNFTNDVVEINNLNLFTLQLKDTCLCLCLLCVRDFGTNLAQEHVKGHKHVKNKANITSATTFLAYHKNWLMQENRYQAHQVYFNPFSVDETVCHLCNKTRVQYRQLLDHIKSNNHRLNVLEMKDNVLVRLQKEVYVHNRLVEKSPDTSVIVEQIANLNKPSTSNYNPRIRCESKSSDDESYVSGSNDASASTHEEENANKVGKMHDIIKSIATDSTNELHAFIEHRFWPHFDGVMRICGQKVECRFCNIIMDKNNNNVIQHILSNNHKKWENAPKKSYNFYCEICNIWVKYDHNWFAHMKSEKHKTRCQNLGEGRRKKLNEYECKTCKQVIFGDDISVKRHNIMANKGKKRGPNRVVLDKRINEMFMREENIVNEANKLVRNAEEVLLNRGNVNECCNAIKESLMETYPNCNVYPFGSQVSGLGSKKSDLDLFVDLGDMYLGDKGQDSTSQVKIVSNVMKIFAKRKGEFLYLNPIPRARTPIVQLYHVKTRLDCDLSFRHGLSVENTKFLRMCIEVQPCTQYLILLLKQWLDYTKLAHRHITTYSLAMMVIFYLQVNNYLPPVHELSLMTTTPQIIIDGWCIMDLSSISVEELKRRIKSCNKSVKEMLTNFFLYYKNFNYASEIICPLLGRPLKKALFIVNPQGFDLPLEMSIYVHKVALNTTDLFKAQSAMCIQDPFDLSHNLTKGCSNSVVDQFKKLCELSYKLLAGK